MDRLTVLSEIKVLVVKFVMSVYSGATNVVTFPCSIAHRYVEASLTGTPSVGYVPRELPMGRSDEVPGNPGVEPS
jgi:hypothetical protein